MAGSDENCVDGVRPSNTQGILRGGSGKFATGIGHTRRALSTINRNIVGAAPYPCAVSKRSVLTEKHAIPNKHPPIPVHRPVTRKLAAAQISCKQQQQPVVQETKPSVPPLPKQSEPRDCPIIDVDEYNLHDDYPVPMFVQHTEAMLEEIDRMDAEVEMEDVDEEELLLDIDSGDKNNTLAVVDYVDDLYAYYRRVESSSCVPPNFMIHQADINERMRGILIDWLIEVHYKFELMEETLYLTVNLIDRFIAVHPIVRKKLQLVGITAMLLACKYEEVSVPVVDDLIMISDKAYTRYEVLNMETLMVNKLQFNLSVPTPYVFLKRFLKAAQGDDKLELVAFFITELALVEYEMLKFPPSLLAAAAVFTAQCTLGRARQWSKTSEMHTNYHECELLECSKLMVTYHQNAATGKLTGVHRKYSTSKYGYAARSEPAHFLLDGRF